MKDLPKSLSSRKRYHPVMTALLGIAVAFCAAFLVPAAAIAAEENAEDAKTITVPDDYKTIQEAIDAAKAGDTVRIREGKYEESLTVDKTLRIIGQGYSKVTINFSNEERHVIYFENAKDCYISGLTLEHIGDDDRELRFSTLDVVGGSLEAEDCRFRNGGGYCVWVGNAGELKMTKCLMEDGGWTGITVEGEGSKAAVIDCTLRRNGNYGGSAALGGFLKLEDCKLIENGWSGASSCDKGSRVELSNCECSKNKQNGVVIFKSGAAKVSDCTMERNTYTGVYVLDEGSKVQVKNCTIKRNETAGVYVENKASADVEDSEIIENTYSGIAVCKDSTADITGNTCSDNGRHGILFEDSSGTAQKNECSGNTDTGIALFGKDTDPKIRENTCTKNVKFGIYAGKGADGYIERNVLDNNGVSGIGASQQGTRPRIRNNRIRNNKSYGIEIWDGADPRLGGGDEISGNLEGDTYGLD